MMNFHRTTKGVFIEAALAHRPQSITHRKPARHVMDLTLYYSIRMEFTFTHNYYNVYSNTANVHRDCHRRRSLCAQVGLIV